MYPQVRFSDEKRFQVHNDGPVRVWRRREDRYRQGFTKNCRKHTASIMMWLCIEASGRARLTRCADRQDSNSYQTQVLTPNLGFIRPLGPLRASNTIIFQQDGASSHTSRSTQRFLRARRVTVLPNWPANSPDLNPVEHCWAWIAKKLVGESFDSKEALEAGVRKVWDERPPTLLPSLYGSMVRRLTAVQVARGLATPY